MIQVTCKRSWPRFRRQSETRAQALGAPPRALTFCSTCISPFTSPPSLNLSQYGSPFSSKYLVCRYAILAELLSSYHPAPITVGLDTAVTSSPAPRLFPPSLLWITERLTFKLCFYTTAIFKAATGPVSAGLHFLLIFKAQRNLASFLNPLISCFTKGHFCVT